MRVGRQGVAGEGRLWGQDEGQDMMSPPALMEEPFPPLRKRPDPQIQGEKGHETVSTKIRPEATEV